MTMAISWTITVNGVDITDDVISAQFSMGRQNPLDDYDANKCSITVRNGTGAFNANSYPISCFITFTPNTTGGKTRLFWLQTINYEDEIEPSASTATIVGIDGYGRLGQFDLINPPGSYYPLGFLTNRTVSQSDDYITAANLRYGYLAVGITTMQTIPPNPTYANGNSLVPTLGSGGAQFITQPYSRVLDWINQNMRTERTPWDVPAFASNQGQFWAIARSQMAYQNIGVTIGNVSSSTDILWDQFSRVGLGGNYYNSVTVAGFGVTGATNLATSTYGVTDLNVQTRDYNSSQATSNSQFIANTLSDTNVLYATISFLDAIQNTAAMTTFLAFKAPVTGWLTVKYQDPGTGIQTRKMQLDGMDVDISPGATRFRAYLSDLTLYSYFVLNDSNFGVLNDDRLGW